MSDTNELVERLRYVVENPSAWEAGFDQRISDLIAKAVTALSPVEAGPVVKPLEWEKGVVDWARPIPGMKYVACSTTPPGSWGWWLDGAPETRAVFPSETEAKAAAQSDYEHRILSALAHPPAQAGAVTEAMVEEAISAYNKSTGYAFPQATHKEQQAGMHAALTAALGAQTPPEGAVPEAQGWRLVPDKASKRWAETMANRRQGQSSTPRCEPPGEYEIEWAFNRINEVLAAAPTPPVNQSEGADRG